MIRNKHTLSLNIFLTVSHILSVENFQHKCQVLGLLSLELGFMIFISVVFTHDNGYCRCFKNPKIAQKY